MNTFKRLLSYMGREHAFRFVIVTICIILNSLVTVVASMFLKTLIDDYIPPLLNNTNPNYSSLLNLIIFMALFYVFSALCALVYNRLMVQIAQNTIRKIRNQMFSHLQKLPVSFFDQNEYGDVMSRFTNDTSTLEEFLSRTLPDAISLLITITGVLITMLCLSRIMTFAVLATLVIILVISRLLTKKSKEYFMRQQKAMGKISGYTEETIEGLKAIKILSGEDTSLKNFYHLNEELTEETTKAVRYANTIMPVMANLGNVQYAVIAILGGLLAVSMPSAGMTVGIIAAFLQMNKSFSSSITQLSSMMNAISQAMAGSTRIFELIDESEEVDSGTVIMDENHNWILSGNEPIKAEGRVVFDNVTFSYDNEKDVLHNVSFELKPKHRVAIVGSTGAGKTTISALLNRFYDVKEGNITIDGINVKDIKKESLRSSIGVVLQNVNIFSDTIFQNIRYGSKNATLEDCIKAAKIANADEFITRLPDGYTSVLGGENHGISAGQMQLISIARAEVSNPLIMVLDEATSSIDTRTELLINEGLDKLMAEHTVFVIAHRLSTVKSADLILVIEDGQIIESGTHEELLEQQGRYADLYSGVSEMI